MERKQTYWITGTTIGLLTLMLGVTYDGRMMGTLENPSARTCPYQVQLSPPAQFEIVQMSFMSRIESLRYEHRIPATAADQYRFAVVTLKITKPAGTSLSLAAADLTLHYYHGNEEEVAPCEGLSWFKSEPTSQVPLLMNPIPGPGFIKQTTSPGMAGSTTVYLDVVFGFMEPDTKECWVCIGQPAMTQPFVCPSPAWKNDGPAPQAEPEPSISATA